MNLGIIGLGLIGASYAKRLSKTTNVFGYDIEDSIMHAMKNDGFIQGDALKHLDELDIVILALNPTSAMTFIKTHGHRLKSGALVSDVCGVKKTVVAFMEKTLKDTVSYLSHHPMSGNPEGGYKNSSATLFENANLVYVTTKKTRDKDIESLHAILENLGFKSFCVLDANAHDAHIAHTSQLTHLISSALVLSGDNHLPKEVMGNSYRDLTRIADIEPDMWSELFMENKEALKNNLSAFIDTLKTYQTHLQKEDQNAIKNLLALTRKSFKNNQ